jgi:epoxyqueuosine reductase
MNTLATLTKAHIVENLLAENLFTKTKSAQIIETLFELLKQSLENGDDVLISGFGKFCVREKSQRRGRNPQSGKPMTLSPRKVVTFKWSGVLRDKINREEDNQPITAPKAHHDGELKKMMKEAEMRSPEGLSHWVQNIIKNFCLESPDNSLKNEANEKAWDEPLVGFSSGSDPLYPQLKEDIGSFLWTPIEVFEKTFPQVAASPSDLTVISWILPQTSTTKADNRKETIYPSERWVRSRLHGEAFNDKLRRYVVDTLQQAGFEAVAPVDSPSWSWETSLRYGFASKWSERHAAYVSGLGTFGLCDGLITPVGKAMRCGSAVSRISIKPTIRPYTDPHAYCLYFSHGTCGKCMKRCPAGAITEEGHDKAKCREYLRGVTAGYGKNQFGLETYGC